MFSKGMEKMKKRKLIWISGVIAAGVVLAAFMSAQKGKSVETISVIKGDVNQYVEDTALVKCRGSQTVYIEGSGKITSINFDAGDEVKKGDILLTMDKSDLELQLKDAEAKVKSAESQLEGAELKSYANKIVEAQAAVEQYEVAFDAASRSYESAKALYEAGAISKEDLNKAEDAYKTAASLLKSTKAQLNDIKNGAPDYLKNSYISQLEQAVVYRDSILRSIDKQQVKSPMDGIVLERLVEENSLASRGMAAFVIGDVKNIELEANILSDDIYKVKVGNEVEITGQSIGDAVIKGRVVKIAPAAKTITSALGVNQSRVPVTIEIIGNTSLLKPGYNVDIKIVTASKENAIVVPDSAVFDYKGSTCVFVVDKDRAVIRQVKKGLEGDKLVEITEGLKEGETVLVKPDNDIKEGMKIKPIKSENK